MIDSSSLETSRSGLSGACLSYVDENQRSVFEQTLIVLTKWAKNRCILSNRNTGFMCAEILEVMLARVLGNNIGPPNDGIPLQCVLKTFFSTYTIWNFNECSIAKDCCGVARISKSRLIASAIDDFEGIDSDYDDEDHKTSITLPSEDTNSDTNAVKDLSLTGDDNDEVHPRKRLRYELGQMRDARRFYDVETTKFKRISIDPTQEAFPGVLDYLDSMSVIHPLNGENLAIRVLESHKKIILQEIARANNLLSDAIGDDEEILFGDDSELLEPVEFRESTFYIVIEIVSDADAVRSEVTGVVQDYSWFMIQEVQAFHGVLVTPHPCPVPIGDSTLRIVVGIDFVSTDPYAARAGATADFAGPISRVLLRSRTVIRDRSDFSTDFQKKFHVKGYLTKDSPFR